MHCTRKVTPDLVWVGVNDRRIGLFEAQYAVAKGISYNSYLLLDEKTVLWDTVDHSQSTLFLENVEYALAGRTLDYLIVQHMEPDHSASIREIVQRYPQVTLVCSAKAASMLPQFLPLFPLPEILKVKEGEVLSVGRHELTFLTAPLVHWPEVIMTYDKTDKVLFTADAFGTFGALNGSLFADEVDFAREYMDEARRYYTNIVGMYGPQVQAVLKKVQLLEVGMICPLHGWVWRQELGKILEKYQKWSAYEAEQPGVAIFYASVYGHTENAAEALAIRLREKGIVTAMYDVNRTPVDELIAQAFRYSHWVLASVTWNGGIFGSMEHLLHQLCAHKLQNRTVAFLQNGTWAATSAKGMRQIVETMKNITILDEVLTLKSSLTEEQGQDLDALADALAASL